MRSGYILNICEEICKILGLVTEAKMLTLLRNIVKGGNGFATLFDVRGRARSALATLFDPVGRARSALATLLDSGDYFYLGRRWKVMVLPGPNLQLVMWVLYLEELVS